MKLLDVRANRGLATTAARLVLLSDPFRDFEPKLPLIAECFGIVERIHSLGTVTAYRVLSSRHKRTDFPEHPNQFPPSFCKSKGVWP